MRCSTSSRPPTCRTSPGSYVAPTLASTTAAAIGLTIPPNLGIKVVNPTDPAAYPIVSQTFIVTYKDPCKAGVPGGQRRDHARS